MSVFDSLRKHFATRAATADEAYRKLVMRLVRNERVNPTEVDATLSTAGRTFDELESEVAQTQRRESLKSQRDELRKRIEAGKDARRQVEALATEASAKIEQIQSALSKKCEPLNAAISDASWAEIRLGDIENELRVTAAPETAGRVDSFAGSIRDLQSERQRLHSAVVEQLAIVKSWERRDPNAQIDELPAGMFSTHEDIRDRADFIASRVGDEGAKLKAMQSDLDAIDCRIRALCEERDAASLTLLA